MKETCVCYTYTFIASTEGTAPELVEGLQDVTVLAKHKAVLTCKIAPGKPQSKIEWYKNGKEIRESQHYSFSFEEAKATLTIPEAETSDTGSYMCKASNKLGSVDTECTLTVQGKCMCSIFSPLNNWQYSGNSYIYTLYA